METELVSHLLVLCERFGTARDLKESTIGRLAAADGSFFARLRAGNTITLKKYDAVVVWFDQNWPEGADWPEDVKKPSPAERFVQFSALDDPRIPQPSGTRAPNRVPENTGGAA